MRMIDILYLREREKEGVGLFLFSKMILLFDIEIVVDYYL